MFNNILIAIDLGPASEEALPMALGLARRTGAALTALYVIDRRDEARHWQTPLFDDELEPARRVLERDEAAARALLAERVAAARTRRGDSDMPPTVVECRVEVGRPAETVMAAARAIGADLLVVGTHGRRGALGSIAEHIARDAGRPVLVVPARTAEQHD